MSVSSGGRYMETVVLIYNKIWNKKCCKHFLIKLLFVASCLIMLTLLVTEICDKGKEIAL